MAALLASACAAEPAADEAKPSTDGAATEECLADGRGYVRARISGAMDQELDWPNKGTECTGAIRPTDGGVRMRFSRFDERSASKIVLVFGIANLREGESANTLPVNVTVIREGSGEFYSTQGDDKCMLDTIQQAPIVGVPHRSRSYRVTARGFCTEPARAVRGTGAILLSRFDFAGRVDFETEEAEADAVMALQ
jgi:hypothetical protein